jgi:hypothetical protein
MSFALARTAFLVAVIALVLPAVALGGTSAGMPFPTNLLTTADATQATGLRVDLPPPDCATRPSDCADLAELNTLDGFNVQPRLSIPFDGAIDVSTVSSDTVFLVDPTGARVGINQIVWEPAATTLHAESDELLRQATTYLLVVTDGVKAADGGELDGSAFRRELNYGQTKDAATKAYRKRLLDALHRSGLEPGHILTASLFTTQSITAVSEKIRRQLDAATPAPISFDIGTLGEHTVFPAASVGLLSFRRQTGTAPTFSTSLLPGAGFPVVPGAIGTVAFGRFSSPDYETAAKVIPPYPTGTGLPVPQGTNTLYVNLYLPSATKPAAGYPVAIFGHGFGDQKQGAPPAVASVLAAHGIATMAINVVGHGGGPLGTLTMLGPTGTPLATFPAGGRGSDQDGNTTIDSTEGVNAAPPATIVSSRDGLRQTVIDLMQLVREIQVGVDVNGDSVPDLDASKISYFGQSFGGIYGAQFLALEPAVHQGVLNVPGGSIVEIARLSPNFRGLVGATLFFRSPNLYNVLPPAANFQNFVENIPLRNEPPRIDTVPGAAAIQRQLDWSEWAQNAGNPVAYAPHLRAEPLDGVPTKSVIVQFAKGDRTVPNPTASALIRAGGLEDRATYFRNDLALAIPGYTVSNPHAFLTNIAGVPAQFAVGAQQQIATFLESGGTTIVDPDGAGSIFETPIAGPLPEVLNF